MWYSISTLRMRQSCLALLIFLSAASAWAAGDGPMGGGSAMSQVRERTPQEIAKDAYNDGVRAIKQASKYEAEIASAKNEQKQAKARERMRKQYEKARGLFVVAVTKQPTMHEAWNYLGYTSRKLGDFDNALTAYGEALRLKPDYEQAVEYRAVAYLGLNRIDDAKAAYLKLFATNRVLAAQLMSEMQNWIAERRNAPSGVTASQLDAFANWVNERATIAQQTASLGADASTQWK